MAFIITFERIAYYILIIVIYAFTFGCMGTEIMAYKARFYKYSYDVASDPIEGVSPRVNFDNLPNSFTAILLFILNE